MKLCALACLLVAASCAPQPGMISSVRVARSHATKPAARVAAFCLAKSGRKVGNGECWTLADEAFKAAGTRRPGRNLRVWGRLLTPANESLMPGDIVEFQSARFADGTLTGHEHTAVVVKDGSWEKISIAEQNWNGRKWVHVREINLKARLAGKVRVYRPQ